MPGPHAARPARHRALLERDAELAALGVAAREAQAGQGSIVLIEGEAGVGKSSLVDSIRSVLPAEGRVLLGWCDDLATPRVLGPLRDLRDHVGTALTAALDAGDRMRVAEALRAELDWAGHASVLVVEDVHWADEATLDVLRFLVSRIAALPAVLVLTYRDEITPDHPLRHLLGAVSRSPRVQRLSVSRLSREAVEGLAAAAGMAAEQIYALTGGNPFLVAEVLAYADLGAVPPSIAEAVAARLGALDPIAREAVERLSVVPSAVERWLVEAVVPGGLAALETAERYGVLSVSPTRVAFRHELTRRAVLDGLSIVRRVAANQAVLTALLARHAERGVDLSRILHHADEVGDETVIVQFGPLATEEAAAAGSHREAVAHGRLVLRHRLALAPRVLLATLERHATECLTVGLGAEAAAAQEEVVALRRAHGDPVLLGGALRLLSRMAWWAGDRTRAEEAGAEAIEVVTGAGDELALGLALSNRSQLLALAGHHDEAIEVGQRAIAIGRSVNNAALLSHALNNVGLAQWQRGSVEEGRAMLDESLAVALDAGEVEHACRAYTNIAWQLYFALRLDETAAVLETAIDYADRQDFVGFHRYLHVTRGLVHLARGSWDEAEREAEWGVNASPTNRCPALVVVGLRRARRGEPGADEALAAAMDLAEELAEAQRLGPAVAALLEAAWLRGDMGSALARVLPRCDEVLRHGNPSVAATVAFWLRMAGQDVPIPAGDDPYTCLARGDWRAAALAWERAGCPYERAMALSFSPEPGDLLTALSIVDAIGAAPLARVVRERMRELGVARIPRGPAASTRENPAGLTDRQVQVVRLLAAGLTNAEIAAKLVLSVRTVDTHVAAILGKLDATSRRHAARRAAQLGLLEAASP